MLYEFAVTPEVFHVSTLANDRAQQVIVVELLRGLSRNGLPANLHKGEWLKVVNAQIESLPPTLKKKIQECLQTLWSRNRIVKHPRGTVAPASERDWVDLAAQAHTRFGLQGIVHTDRMPSRSEAAEAPTIQVADVLDSPQWLALREKQTPAVPTTDDGYRRMLAPVLRHAKKAVLIDRYLTPHENKFFRTVKVCIKLLRSDPRGFRATPIYIHAGDPSNERRNHRPELVRQRLQAWAEALEGFITQD